MTRTIIPNSKLFFLNQNYNRSSFNIKSLDPLQEDVRFSTFRTYPEFETFNFRVFETKPTFPFLSKIIDSKQN